MGSPPHRWGEISAIVVVLATAAAAACHWPVIGSAPWTVAINTVITTAFVGTSLLLWREGDQRHTAQVIAAAAVLWSVSWLNEWNAGPGPLLAEVLGPLAQVFGVWGLLCYPDGAVRRRVERVVIAVIGGWTCGGALVVAFFSRPEWHRFSASSWWPALAPDRHAFAVAQNTLDTGEVILPAVLVVLVVQKAARLRGADRRVVVPVVIALIVASVAEGAGNLLQSFVLPASAEQITYNVQGLSYLMIPVAFLAGLARRQLTPLAIGRLVTTLAEPVCEETMRDALRTTLGDPGLDIFYWDTDTGTYVTVEGRTVVPDDHRGADLVVRYVRTGQGEPLACVVFRRTREVGLLAPMLSASRMALENTRLIASLRAAQLRMVEAGLAERHRIERDLHDGAQQRLLGIGMYIAAARGGTGDPQVLEALDEIGRELRTAHSELRELASGVHPGRLAEDGIAAALESVTERLPLPVTVHADPVRCSRAAELTAYFFVCEALTNVVKHSRATRATVSLRRRDRTLAVEVGDDGIGGVRAGDGRGIGGLQDRVKALGGRMTIDSEAGQGTLLRMEVPCE